MSIRKSFGKAKLKGFFMATLTFPARVISKRAAALRDIRSQSVLLWLSTDPVAVAKKPADTSKTYLAVVIFWDHSRER